MGRSYRCWVMMVFAFCVSSSVSAAGLAHLILHSDPGDAIGRGEDFDLIFTPQPGEVFGGGVYRTVGGRPSDVYFAFTSRTLPLYSSAASLEFATTQLGIPLVPGSYPNAQRAAFAAPGFAGLDVSFSYAGCNTLTGSFDVDDVEFGADLSIERFSARFVQYCEGSTGALHGSLYFDATATPPDLTITKTHTGDFTQGQTGIYTLTIGNEGSGPTDGTVTVTDTLPAGLTALAISGAGWNCTLSTLTCTRSDAVSAGSSYPAISVTVRAARDAFAFVNNTATVAGGGELDPGNDIANDLTRIWPAPIPGITPAPLLEGWGRLLVCGLIGAVAFVRLRRISRANE